MIPQKLMFFLSTFLGIFFVDTYYANAPYPFESINISHYTEELLHKFTTYQPSSKLSLYLVGIMFSYIYHVLYNKIKTGRILKGVITSLVIFSAYILTLFFYLDSSKLDYIKLYLLQDLIALFIFYLTVAILYRRSENEN